MLTCSVLDVPETVKFVTLKQAVLSAHPLISWKMETVSEDVHLDSIHQVSSVKLVKMDVPSVKLLELV